MSYGGDFGHPPKDALCFVSVKNLPNPGRELRKLDGRNKDLRRFVVESEGAKEKIDAVTVVFQQAISARLTTTRGELERAVLCSYWCLRQVLKDELAKRVCDWLVIDCCPVEQFLLCVGCVAGQHRSVSVVEHLCETKALLKCERNCWPLAVVTYHRELEAETKKKKSELNRRGLNQKRK